MKIAAVGPAGSGPNICFQLVSSRLAEIISEVLGREIPARQIESDEFLKASLKAENLDAFPYQARSARAISKRYSSHDFIGNPNVLTWLLSQEPTTFRQFAQREFGALGVIAHNFE